MFDVIERLKSEWTDKYVVINSSAPELARFAHATGTVRTVNMNGRCLVEFDQFNNTAWYDIDPAALKIVAQPLPKPVEKEAAKPAAAAKPPAAAKPAAAKPAAKTAGSGKPSTADILAAARAKTGGAAAAPAAKPAASTAASAEKKPAASAGKLSTAEILARARAAKSAAAEPAAPEAPAQELASAETEPKVAPAKPAAAKKQAAGSGSLPTTTAEKIAWCRQHDATG